MTTTILENAGINYLKINYNFFSLYNNDKIWREKQQKIFFQDWLYIML